MISTKKSSNITTKNIKYSDKWNDLISTVNGEKITYDKIGNPLIYTNGMKLTWNTDSMIETINLNNIKVKYTYDDAGNRTSKNVNGTITQYLLDSNLILGTITNGKCTWYIYNGVGSVIGFYYENTSYYYIKDAFNNIVSIADEDGNSICTYTYDSWGNVISIEGNKQIAEFNIFRYQSYPYDSETGFYYLKTRYYDPSNYRFLNADGVFSASNLYTYCYNNPIIYADSTGMSPQGSVEGSDLIFQSSYNLSGVEYVADRWGGYFQKKSNHQQVYFNCYLWALKKYKTSASYGDPGMYSKRSLSSKFTVDEVLTNVKADLVQLGYSYKAISSPMASLGSNQSIIALRTTTTSSPYYTKYGLWDYHFMRKISGYWTYKGGRTGRVFELEGGYSPSNVAWNMASWDSKTSKWSIVCKNVYTSTITYFIITYK